uniref:Peptidase S59 domain-containing protein n=1 Tax=Caenorhabditis japonica TaxID=281687 RepID=A0A8R1IIU8_CAEJA
MAKALTEFFALWTPRYGSRRVSANTVINANLIKTTLSASTGGTTFGQNTGSSLFGGNQQQNTGGSLFGQNNQQPAGGSLFGGSTTNTTGGGLFGQNTQAQPQQSGFSFGGGNATNTTNAFGQPAAANTGGSLFGNTSNANTSGSLFGAKPATSGGFNFGGQQNTTTNAFGSNTNTGGGLFGNNAAKPGGLFGSNTTTGTTGGGLFGSQPQATGGGLFGSNNQAIQPLNTGFGNAAQPQVVIQQQVAPVPVIGVTADVLQMQANMKSLQSQLTHAPYGDSPLLKYNNAPEGEAKDSPMSTQRQLRFLAAKKGALTVSSPGQESSFIVPPISKVMSDLSPAVNRSADVTRDLNYTSKEAPPTLGRGLRNGTFNPNSSIANQSFNNTSAINRTIDSAIDASLNGSSNRLGVRGSVRRSNLKQLDLSVLTDSSRIGSNGRDDRTADPDALPRISASATSRRSEMPTTPQLDPVQAVVQRHQERNKDPPSLNLDTTCDEYTGLEPVSAASSTTSVATTPTEDGVTSPENSAAGVRLSKPDYFSLPTINEMKNMVKNGKVVLEDGLTIGRSSYGSVYWPGKIEIRDIVLDEVVIFRHREVTVYPDEEAKPAEGQELNRPAEVTLERIWFTDKKSKKEVRDVVKLAEIGWREHLERQTIRMGASFKDFRAETGSWVFRVEHFSKYGLADDDEPMDVAPPPPPAAPLQSVDLNTSSRDVNNQVQRKKVFKTSEMQLREVRF